MASSKAEGEVEQREEEDGEDVRKLVCSFLGLSFSVLLALLPRNAISVVVESRELRERVGRAEEQLRQMRSIRKEDSKANTRVVEMFATHRNSWRAEEKRLLRRIDAANQEVDQLNARIADFQKFEAEANDRMDQLEREIRERDHMIRFMSTGKHYEQHEQQQQQEQEEDHDDGGGQREDLGEEYSDWSRNGNDQYQYQYKHQHQLGNGFSSDFMASASECWTPPEKANLWQDVHCETLESMYHMKPFVARRESPWKADGDSTRVSSKLKFLEQELLNLEKIGGTDLSNVPSLMRKQTKRYQALSEKIDDLCRRMQASGPSETTLNLEFRTQRQTEFLLEAFRLQQHAAETGEKLLAIQAEIGKKYHGDELVSQAKVTTKRSLDSIKNNFREIQRNLEIWLARIIGDLEGILARDGASRVREYCISRYPFVQ